MKITIYFITLIMPLFISCNKTPKIQPQDQVTFLQKIEEFKNVESEGFLLSLADDKSGSFTNNPKKKEGAKFLEALVGYEIKNWVGKIVEIKNNLDDININDNVEVFVLESNHVKFYLTLDKDDNHSLKFEQVVLFSGRIINEKSQTLAGGLQKPEFILGSSSIME